MKKVYVLLDRCGFPAHLNGTRYLAQAAIMQGRASRPLMVTKEIYPAIAKANETKAGAVERGIRGAVLEATRSKVWATGWAAMGGGDDRPTNGEAICRFARVLDHED